MAADRAEILAWLAALAGAIVTDADDAADLAQRIDDAAGLVAVDFAGEIVAMTRVIAENVRSAAAFRTLAITGEFQDRDAGRAVTVLSAAGLALAVGRVDWPSRPLARYARTLLVDRAQEAYAVASALGPEMLAWLSGLVAVAARLVSDRAANAAPLVLVETGIPLPSMVVAYQLYGDAKRAGALVDMAGAATPLLMPVAFEALAR